MKEYKDIFKALSERILILDGATGSLIQSLGLGEEDYRGGLFQNSEISLKGNHDLLSLTRPEIVLDIHRQYLEAGADIIKTNTFTSNHPSQKEYGMESKVPVLNSKGTELACQARNHYYNNNGRYAWVAGSIGPSGKTLSISPKIEQPAYRDVTFDYMVQSYEEAAFNLIIGGADLFLAETIFDTLNAKACYCGMRNAMEKAGKILPIMISGTITDASGRILSGQTLEAFYYTIKEFNPFSIGLNCALGSYELRPYIRQISELSSFPVSAHPNAGLPDELGQYTETPDFLSTQLEEAAKAGELNIAGGCCGTTPDHIRVLAQKLKNIKPRKYENKGSGAIFTGLEALHIKSESLFVNVGERTNVAGSRKFARLIREKKYDEALEIARDQVESGAQIIDVNLDDALLDAEEEMSYFLNLMASDPEISRVPIMVDSSRWDVLEIGLKSIQGKGIVNSISLKEGEALFLEKARKIRDLGAASVIMAFDEQGQADSIERRLKIVRRSYQLLKSIDFPDSDMIFDLNIFAVATGIEEHRDYARSFIESLGLLKKEFPNILFSGGVSNVSFSFRGNDTVREAMHSVFLYHAVKAGLTMGIVNAGQLTVYDEIPEKLLKAVEDVILNRYPEAEEALLELASEYAGQEKKSEAEQQAWREEAVESRIAYSLRKGITNYIEKDINECLEKIKDPLLIIEGPLMAGMEQVGELFGAGKMFLPQVVKSARVMKQAVALLLPYMKTEQSGASSAKKRILLATVKGDVHDIGKNIVSVVLQCNNYDVIDMGVMVPAEDIIKKAEEEKVDIIGLSGLITPSLEEMASFAGELEKRGWKRPLLIGGATTSAVHTAIKIAPCYSHPVVYVPDASRAASVVSRLFSGDTEYRDSIKKEQESLRNRRINKIKKLPFLSLKEVRDKSLKLPEKYKPVVPKMTGIKRFEKVSAETLRPFIDWRFFLYSWDFKGNFPLPLDLNSLPGEAVTLINDANHILDKAVAGNRLFSMAVAGIFSAGSEGDDIICVDEDGKKFRFSFLRQQREKKETGYYLSLADYILPASDPRDDYMGLFLVNSGYDTDDFIQDSDLGDDYNSLLVNSLSDRLAEATAEWLHYKLRTDLWGYEQADKPDITEILKGNYIGIRPAPGYGACPDHRSKITIIDALGGLEKNNVSLTESCMIHPAASVCGFYFSTPESQYFSVGRIEKDQLEDYVERTDLKKDEINKWLSGHLID